jgi:hypothetical protein
MLVLHVTLTNKKNRKKKKPFIKSPSFLYGSGFSLNIYIIMHLFLKNEKKN